MATSKKKKKDLSHGRPPTFRKPAVSLSSKATRTLIRSHHQLQKARCKAVKEGDAVTAAAIEQQIQEQGGLKTYQKASITGQSTERGGDSSRVLMKWLNPTIRSDVINGGAGQGRADTSGREKFRMLEVGALSTTNACSRSSLFSVTRIDLNSQGPGIEQQDFMERPLPTSDTERFDVISLSLVLNYVPDAAERGEMLRRTCSFLRSNSSSFEEQSSRGDQMKLFPSLFLVLPAPCVTNSRYMDAARLKRILESLGYELLEQKMSAKLAYYLWRYSGHNSNLRNTFPKVEANPGKTRNNFTIVLR